MSERAIPNHYEILQLQSYANPALVTASYRILSKLYHPDTAKEQANIEKFRLLQEAYDILSDPQKRLAYDQELRLKTPGAYAYAGSWQPPVQEHDTTQRSDPAWHTGNPVEDNTWAPYTPTDEDLEFYRNLYDYDAAGRRRRTLILLVIYVALMGAGLISGVMGFITAFGSTGHRGQALLYFAIGIALIVVAQLEAYFT